jgi:hypothetical protein
MRRVLAVLLAGLMLVTSVFVSAVTILILARLVMQPMLRLRANLAAAAQDPANADRYQVRHPKDHELGDLAACRPFRSVTEALVALS